MLKKVGVFVMMLAGLGAVLPATAAAADRDRNDRGREVRTVVVQQRDVYTHNRYRKIDDRQARVDRRGDLRK